MLTQGMVFQKSIIARFQYSILADAINRDRLGVTAHAGKTDVLNVDVNVRMLSTAVDDVSHNATQS